MKVNEMVKIEVEIGFEEGLSKEEQKEIGNKLKTLLEILGMEIDSMEWKNGRRD